MMNEKQKETLDFYFEVIAWFHKAHPTPNRALNAAAKEVCEKPPGPWSGPWMSAGPLGCSGLQVLDGEMHFP